MAQRKDWKSTYEMEVDSHDNTKRWLNESQNNATAFQRMRDNFEREAKQHRDLAEARRQEIDRLKQNQMDLIKSLERRNADYDLLAMLIRRCLS